MNLVPDENENPKLQEMEQNILKLKSPDVNIRVESIMALAKFGGRASEPLIRAIKQEFGNYGVGQIASAVLSKVNEPWMVKSIAAARSEKWYIDQLYAEFNAVSMTPLVGKVHPKTKINLGVQILDKEIGPMVAALISSIKQDQESVPSVANRALISLGWDGNIDAIANTIPKPKQENARKGSRPLVILILISLICLCFFSPLLISMLK